MSGGRLSIVATPIGNLADASERMKTVLSAADVVLAEDSRRTGRLLMQFGVEARLLALHEHNERDLVDELVRRLAEGEHLALVSDAGTPAVSDPGFRLVRAAHAAGVRVETVPGPSAVIAALSASGLPTDRFVFEGFLPAKAQARKTRLTALSHEPRTMVFYEAVHRISDFLSDAGSVFGADRMACVARELTKRHEQIVTTTLAELCRQIDTGQIVAKGEFVVLVAGAEVVEVTSAVDPELLVRELLSAGIPVKAAAKAVSVATGAPRNKLYQFALDLQD
ncbi:MAG: 16S rRNA (cytidine(1402)-2'-O)-methyltransferase [Pseudomonadota bacterium]